MKNNPKTVTKGKACSLLYDAVAILNDLQLDDSVSINSKLLGEMHKLFNEIPQDMAESLLGR